MEFIGSYKYMSTTFLHLTDHLSQIHEENIIIVRVFLNIKKLIFLYM